MRSEESRSGRGGIGVPVPIRKMAASGGLSALGKNIAYLLTLSLYSLALSLTSLGRLKISPIKLYHITMIAMTTFITRT